MNKTYEVEVKSLLGSAKNAQKLRDKLNQSGYKLTKSGSQLNHYFIYKPTVADNLIKATEKFLSNKNQQQFTEQLKSAKEVSIRTRQTDQETFFVAKLSVGDDSSANGVLRHEIQQSLELDLATLDQILLNAGLEYQAKWSRDREEYRSDESDFYITIDKNAGYGYLAEVELEVTDPAKLETARNKIISLMNELEITELSQSRLSRMFDYYNDNWADYYSTEEIFTIE